MKTSYYANLLLGARRGTALVYPATLYVGLMTANKGARANSTVYTVSTDYICVMPAGGTRLHLYRCTTGGTSAAAQPGTYLGAPGEVITDGTAVFTEQTAALQAMTGASMAVAAEPAAANGYARITIASNTTNWAAAAAMAQANAGAAWTWPQATPAGWTTGPQACWGIVLVDVLAQGSGNVWEWFGMPSPIQVSALATPSIAAGALTTSEA